MFFFLDKWKIVDLDFIEILCEKRDFKFSDVLFGTRFVPSDKVSLVVRVLFEFIRNISE